MTIIPVILSGGSGTRVWPLSRQQYPKQFISLLGKNSLFQEALIRLHGLTHIAAPIVICNSEHRFLAAEQLKQIGVEHSTILLEPDGRNTAPAITAAALKIIKDSNLKDAMMLVLSADHQIENIKEFHKVVNNASFHAKAGRLVTFGIIPDSPNSDYGYINFSNDNNKGCFKVNKFVEKPNQETAELYINEGNYLWNSGMFMFKPRVFLDELATHSEQIVRMVKKSLDNASKDLDFIRLEKKSFESSPSSSIDYAVMEKSNNVVVLKLDAGWSDLGSWSSLYEVSNKDNNGNVLKGDVFSEETTNSYVHAGHHMVATVGINNLVIIDTPNATLVADKDKASDVQKIVKKLQKLDREEYKSNRKVHRPWGWYDSIESGLHFQVKRLHVYPNAKLSLQKHQKRAEHWVIVRGKATVVNGKKKFILSEGDSTFIPIDTVHSLENTTSELLEIIEVQSGVYLGEDDIIRFEDIYGRAFEKNQ
jgi:mannose-1-phosphate guanylyltransferase/mannose-6-phosphate isomerase